MRSAILAGLLLAAATPALAYQIQTVKAPPAGGAHFVDFGRVARMMPDTTSETYHIGAPDRRGPAVVYELPRGKAADRVNVSDPRDNPFMGAAMTGPAAASAPTR